MSNESTGHTADDTDWEALARYFSGESSEEEIAEVERWLADDLERAERVGALSDLVARSRVAVPEDLDVEGALSRVRERLADPPVLPLDGPRASPARTAAPVRPRTWATVAMKIAAGVVLVFGAALLFRALVLPGPGASPGDGAGRFVTATGEWRELLLGDGTRVLLGPFSDLVVAARYGVDHRSVSLSGEAMFDVADALGGLFTVTAAGAIIRDLGTAFSVRTMMDGRVEVVVTEGSVSLHRESAERDQGTVLREGDRGAIAPDGVITLEQGTASADDLAWTQGELVFRDAPMERVVEDLRRWYGLELRITDANLADRRLTASFADESRDQVARIVALALGMEAELAGDTVLLRSNGGSR